MSELTNEQGKAIDLGYLIGQKREKMGLGLAEVVEATHLRTSHIRAIESGAFDQLPGEPYARAYIKRYIEFLELDVEAMMGEYDGSAIAAPKRAFMLPEIFSHETHASGMSAVLGLIVAGMCVITWNLANPIIRTPLVVPFVDVNMPAKTVLPHRCDGDEPAYPPCRWENIELWYTPVKPAHHLFAPHD